MWILKLHLWACHLKGLVRWSILYVWITSFLMLMNTDKWKFISHGLHCNIFRMAWRCSSSWLWHLKLHHLQKVVPKIEQSRSWSLHICFLCWKVYHCILSGDTLAAVWNAHCRSSEKWIPEYMYRVLWAKMNPCLTVHHFVLGIHSLCFRGRWYGSIAEGAANHVKNSEEAIHAYSVKSFG